MVEELLDRIQPGRVLSVQQHMRFEPAGGLVDLRVLVDRGVVHEHDDLLPLRLLVDSEFVQCPVQETIKDHVIGPSLGDLGRYHAVYSHGCDHREGVARLLDSPFVPLKKCHLLGQTQTRVEILRYLGVCILHSHRANNNLWLFAGKRWSTHRIEVSILKLRHQILPDYIGTPLRMTSKTW